MANWTAFSEKDYLPALRTAVIWQAVLGAVASLMLDSGQVQKAWAVALVCHAAVIWLLLLRRPLNPTRLDLAVIRYAALPLTMLIAVCGPWLLQVLALCPK